MAKNPSCFCFWLQTKQAIELVLDRGAQAIRKNEPSVRNEGNAFYGNANLFGWTPIS
jgi:hypothetical protein